MGVSLITTINKPMSLIEYEKACSAGTRGDGNQPPVESPNARSPNPPPAGGSNAVAAHAVRVARGGKS
jgi:hypothetical protein